MRLPTYFISHGGGPWPWIAEMRDCMAGLTASLAGLLPELGVRPAAVLMVSAHWEAPAFTLMTHAQPPMLYDYYGFPPHTYQIRYAAAGAPWLAPRVRGLLEAAGLPVEEDAHRGFDHGTFTPMAVMAPQADVPVLQLSLKSGLVPAEHLALGRALAPLRDEQVMIVGSGLSYHNLRAFGPAGRPASIAFDGWLQEAVVASSPTTRAARLMRWEQAPGARAAHPREEHLMPLLVASGAAEDDAAVCNYHEDTDRGIVVSSFRFGALPGRG